MNPPAYPADVSATTLRESNVVLSEVRNALRRLIRCTALKILMLENHHRFATIVIGEFLDDHEVELQRSVDAAIRTVYPPDFDVVLVDYDLDDGKGDRFVRWLRARGYEGRVVAISAHAEGNDALVAAGADAICSKMNFASIADYL